MNTKIIFLQVFMEFSTTEDKFNAKISIQFFWLLKHPQIKVSDTANMILLIKEGGGYVLTHTICVCTKHNL